MPQDEVLFLSDDPSHYIHHQLHPFQQPAYRTDAARGQPEPRLAIRIAARGQTRHRN